MSRRPGVLTVAGVVLVVLGGLALVVALRPVPSSVGGAPEPRAGPATPTGRPSTADPAPSPTPSPACPAPTAPLPSPGTDLAAWLAALPRQGEVGDHGTVEAGGDDPFALQASEPVVGLTVRGGSAAALRTTAAVEVACSLLAGSGDGLKPHPGTVLRDSVVTLSYGAGAHADHVQATDRDDVTLRRVRLVAENAEGATDDGWTAAFFVHGDATGWVLEDVHVAAGSPDRAIRSWFPVRLNAGEGIVRRVVVDRAVMRGDDAFLVTDDATPTVWEDVFIRELDGSLTPVPAP